MFFIGFLTTCCLFITFLPCRTTGTSDADPNIDLININDAYGPKHVNTRCKNRSCPAYTVADAGLPSVVEARDYTESYWVSTTYYEPVNGSCMEGEEMKSLYIKLCNFFKGVNTMGLLIDRTLPVRVMRQFNEEDKKNYCYAMFYLPKIYSMNPPAPLSVEILMGYNYLKRCYTLQVKGRLTWKRTTRLHEALRKFLKRKKIPTTTNQDIILDVYTGYGVPDEEKYAEVMICDENIIAE